MKKEKIRQSAPQEMSYLGEGVGRKGVRTLWKEADIFKSFSLEQKEG